MIVRFLASLGSLDNVKPSEVAAQSDVLNSVSAEETWVADSSSPAVPTKGFFFLFLKNFEHIYNITTSLLVPFLIDFNI